MNDSDKIIDLQIRVKALESRLSPEPSHDVGKKASGLYEKFKVERTDGSSAPGKKHDGCRYFVLDITHDPLAAPALIAYAKAAREAGYGPLADDLERLCPSCAGATVTPNSRDGAVSLSPSLQRTVTVIWERLRAGESAESVERDYGLDPGTLKR